jgi:hypothetical protein
MKEVTRMKKIEENIEKEVRTIALMLALNKNGPWFGKIDFTGSECDGCGKKLKRSDVNSAFAVDIKHGEIFHARCAENEHKLTGRQFTLVLHSGSRLCDYINPVPTPKL